MKSLKNLYCSFKTRELRSEPTNNCQQTSPASENLLKSMFERDHAGLLVPSTNTEPVELFEERVIDSVGKGRSHSFPPKDLEGNGKEIFWRTLKSSSNSKAIIQAS